MSKRSNELKLIYKMAQRKIMNNEFN